MCFREDNKTDIEHINFGSPQATSTSQYQQTNTPSYIFCALYFHVELRLRNSSVKPSHTKKRYPRYIH